MVSGGVDLGRDAARELARRELSDPRYHRDDPTLLSRASAWLHHAVDRLLDGVGSASPGGWIGILVVVALLALVVVAIVVRVGGVRGSAATADPLLTGRLRTASEHRADADAAAAAGRYDLAVRDRLRATARDLETRGLLEPRPGRTADELAAEAARALPALRRPLRDATRVFDDVWYGGRPATPEMYAVVRDADEQVRAARVPSGAPA